MNFMPMGPYWGEFLALALVHGLAVVLPGPDFAVTLQQSVRFGRRVGVYTALGIGAGISVHVAYTVMGLGALMHAVPQALWVARWLGAAYLVYLGWSLLKAAPAAAPSSLSLEPQDPMGAHPRRAFARGFLTNATNPKATLFFVAVFTTMVSPSTPLAVQVLYGVWMCCVNALWFVVVALLFTHEPIRAAFLRSGHWFERSMGVLLCLFAVRLLGFD